MTDTSTPFRRLNGATANITNVTRSVIFAFTAVPILTSASIGIPKAAAYVGRSTKALIRHPRTVIVTVPTAIPIRALFLVLFLR